jgi:sensor histidine kinase YesM
MIPPASFNIFYLIAANYLVVFFAVAIKLLNHWYKMQNQNVLLEKEGMEIELKLKEAELKLLKAQIHPHFLFNTLNNLYGLALSGSDKTPEIVLKISSLLDFMLYRSNRARVQLREELNYIRDYMDLEKLRYHNIRIEWEENGIRDEHYIAPMLLQPLVENAFKHGTSGDNKDPWITIKILVDSTSQMEFSIWNSKPQDKGGPGVNYDGNPEGIGLINIKKRLNILYADHHQLEICEDIDVFGVSLDLSLNHLKK